MQAGSEGEMKKERQGGREGGREEGGREREREPKVRKRAFQRERERTKQVGEGGGRQEDLEKGFRWGGGGVGGPSCLTQLTCTAPVFSMTSSSLSPEVTASVFVEGKSYSRSHLGLSPKGPGAFDGNS